MADVPEKIQKIIDQWPVVEMSQKELNTLPGFSAAQILNGPAKEKMFTRARKLFKDVPDEIPVIVEYEPVEDIWLYRRVAITD